MSSKMRLSARDELTVPLRGGTTLAIWRLGEALIYHTWTLLKGIAMSTLLGVGTQVTFGNGL
jgi:hypothetical protein